MVLIFFAGCIKLRFKRERSASRPLTVFGNSSSVQLVGTFPGENCSTSTTYYITDEINRRWVEFHNTPTFSVRRKNTNRNEKGYSHFLEVGINTQVDYHYWKTTETLVGEENSLPCEMRQMSKNKFKINVHDTLLRMLSEENDYYWFTRLNNKNFQKIRLLIFAMYMIVNLIKLNLFLFICLFI